MNNECVSCGRTSAAGSVRCACGGSRFRIVRAAGNIERGSLAAPRVQRSRAQSDAELLGELKRLVDRSRPSTADERADDERREARRFAMSRGGLIDLDRGVAPSRRYVMLNGPLGPALVPVPSAAEARAAADRVNFEFERVERAMGRAS